MSLHVNFLAKMLYCC